MISFEEHGTELVLAYSSEWGAPVEWVDNKLESAGDVTFSRVFTVRQADLLELDTDAVVDDYADVRRFVIGRVEGDYRVIRSDVLGLQHDLKLATSVTLSRSLFIAERNISIFGRIDDLVDQQIVVGGPSEGAIPEEDFARLLREFPNTTELRLYSRARVTRILREYLETMSDAEERLVSFMSRRRRATTGGDSLAEGRISAANDLELEKFTYVRDRVAEMLSEAEAYSEAEWQESVADLFLLVFPQYIAVLPNVHIKEHYSRPLKATDRYIDLVLVGANGTIDIIEIKKPFARGLMSKRQYRDNHVPVRELSGSIMQVEKYLFYLSKSGVEGEKLITKTRISELPAGLEIKITNPKAIILSGRDNDFSEQEAFDFEFVRRKYANVVDIITYDDLLRRLDNLIEALKKRRLNGDGRRSDDGQQ